VSGGAHEAHRLPRHRVAPDVGDLDEIDERTRHHATGVS
jgi:hypothetical protein